MNRESAISALSKSNLDGKRWQGQERKEGRFQGTDHDQVRWQLLGGAGNQATNNKTVGIIHARNRRLMQERNQLSTASIVGSRATGDPNVTPSPTIPLIEGDRDIERQLADLKLEDSVLRTHPSRTSS